MNKKAVLMILDGWGEGDKSQSDAIFNANTPFIDSLHKSTPNTTLLTHGENVGLPSGQMGNSEVGHLNVGAGRIVYQDLAKINKAITDNELEQNEALINAINNVKTNGGNLHFIGLVSEGGVHSSQAHLHALCSIAAKNGVQNHFVHAFTDGRDCDPKSGLKCIEALQTHLATTGGKLASVIGRYFAMDRDNRWERVKKAYDLLCAGKGEASTNLLNSIQESYNNDITDEFLEPIVCNENNLPVATIQPNDTVICFNFRTDRCREISIALTQQNFPEEGLKVLPLHYTTMTKYDASFKNVNIMFEKNNLSMTLGEVLSKNKRTQIRIAETEKYPHVTFFFSGGREEPFAGEKRLMVNSPKVATYDLQPEMSAPEVTSTIVKELENSTSDFVCLNFANPDMVGHTGVYEAVIKAVETIDNCAQQVVEAGTKSGYSFIIIADHGNADYVINPDGSPNTAHSTNPVPCFVLTNNKVKLNKGILADVAPTILQLMELEQPAEMSGRSLIINK